MREVDVKTSSPYSVLIGQGILESLPRELSERSLARAGQTKLIIVTDENVAALYLEKTLALLKEAGFEVFSHCIPASEQAKNTHTLVELLETMAAIPLSRTDLLIALGGGVVGDLSGFAAAVYLRGMRFVQVPTTLLAAVDSSVGGKTAVDLKGGKNLMGAFWQPALVLCDTALQKTLPPEELACGYGEVVKYAMLDQGDLGEQLFAIEPHLPPTEAIIARCVEMKRDIVQRDEYDKGERALLNFGHTPAHAIEKLSAYSVKHGIAVGMGMKIITNSALAQDIIPQSRKELLDALLGRFGLDRPCPYNAGELANAALNDKKRKADFIELIYPAYGGGCVITPTPLSYLESIFAMGLEE